MSERDTQTAIVELLRKAGWHVIVTSTRKAQAAQIAGVPDVIAIRHDSVLFVECKSERGHLRPAQERFRDRIEQHTGRHVRYVLARDVNDVLNETRETAR